ncbi:MAG: glycosyltransferase [Lachnospiraceae bacterium]|nr:glycosyltransferase [Lachnospiraceae bacterium]
MHILVNDIAASKTGALSILQDFYQYVRQEESGHEWIFLLSGDYLEETDKIRIRVIKDVKKGWLHRLYFDFFSFGKLIREYRPDVFFSMQNTLPRKCGCRQVLYVHQPLGFQKTKRFSLFKKSEREYAIYQHLISRLIDRSIVRADKTIVQTAWMRDAVIKKTHVDAGKVVSILPDIKDLSSYRDSLAISPNMFFFPSGNILYKNHKLLYLAAEILLGRGISDFVIRVTLTEEELRSNIGNAKPEVLARFDCMGRIERENVYEQYTKSVLLFPSYIETFGYPPAEARAVGSLVLASDCPFCREVLAGYENAYYFDPFDAKALAELMEDVMTGKIRHEKPVSPVNGRQNSWEQVVNVLTENDNT